MVSIVYNPQKKRALLAVAQRTPASDPNMVVCAGCGRELEVELTHLDHIRPKSDGGENHITNRILLCLKCNADKNNELTIPGLRKKIKENGWLKDETKADKAKNTAENTARIVANLWEDSGVKKFVENPQAATLPRQYKTHVAKQWHNHW